MPVAVGLVSHDLTERLAASMLVVADAAAAREWCSLPWH
jgi:hypothetical protein